MTVAIYHLDMRKADTVLASPLSDEESQIKLAAEAIQAGLYKKVAMTDDADAVAAYVRSQNGVFKASWSGDLRSSNVGDIFVQDERVFLMSSFGLAALNVDAEVLRAH